MRLVWIAVALAVALLGAPEAQACAVCFSGNDATRVAFILTTAFLSVLPLAMVGGVVWWIRQRLRQLEQERSEGEAVGSGRPPGV